jgi:hypothetical protein
MRLNYIITIFILQTCIAFCCDAEESIPKIAPSAATLAPIGELANKAFTEKNVMSSLVATADIAAAMRSLADVSLDRLKSGDESQKKVAARVLGILRERRAIPLLVQNIGLVELWRSGSSNKGGVNVEEDYPACAALKNIGGLEVIAAVSKFRESKASDDPEVKVIDALLAQLK